MPATSVAVTARMSFMHGLLARIGMGSPCRPGALTAERHGFGGGLSRRLRRYIDDRHEADHAVGSLGVGEDVAVQQPLPGLFGLEHDVVRLSDADVERVHGVR